MTSTAADIGNLEGVAAAAAAAQGSLGFRSHMRTQHIPEPVATSTPEYNNESVAVTLGRREKSNTQPSVRCARTYNEILGRRPIHSPRSKKAPKKPSSAPTTPKTPKPCKASKLQSKNRLKFEKSPLQSTARRQEVESETNSPLSAARRKQSLSIKEGRVSRRRPLYPCKSPRSAVEVEEQSIGQRRDHNNHKAEPLPKRRCYDVNSPQVEAPKEEEEPCRRLSPQKEVKPIDISLAASKDGNDFCQPSCSSATAKPQKVETRIVPQGQGQSKVQPVPLNSGAAENKLTDIPAPAEAEALALNPDTAAAPDPNVDTKESILKPDDQVLNVSTNSLESVNRELEMETDSLEATQVDLPKPTEFQELQLNNTRASEETIAKNSCKTGCILM